MGLFVVNRHGARQSPGNSQEGEKSKLDAVLKRIERNKQKRYKQREREKNRQIAKLKTVELRQIKRAKRAKLVPVPNSEKQSDEFIDKTVQTEINEPESKISKPDVANLEGFTVLGAEGIGKKDKVKRVLPRWLSHPTVISVNLQNLKTKVSQVKALDKGIRNQLKANGIKYFFPVQAEVIPWLLQSNAHSDIMFPRDICVSAPTGSGKTLAFVLPVIQALKKYNTKKIRALAILPTQDLAAQVFKTFKNYAQNTNLDVCLIKGNNLFEQEQKQLCYENPAFGYLSKVDILVSTAGRLVDHIKLTNGFSLEFLEYLIIDEADRVLDSVQNDWLYHLEKHINHKELALQNGKIFNLFSLQKSRPPQKLLFSATLSQDPEKLQKLQLFQPKLFTSVVESDDELPKERSETFIGKYTTPRELTEKYVVCSTELKPLVLYKFINNEKLTKTIIFTHSIENGHRLTILLKSLFKNQMKIHEISSSSKNRNDLIRKFAAGDIDLLICTDSLARGIDLPGVKCVISYSAPKYLKTYIHRAGRTARAGELGLAITLLHNQQLHRFKNLLQQSGKTNVEELKISEEDLEPIGKQYKLALKKLRKTVEVEGKMELNKVKSAKRKIKVKKLKKTDVTEKK